MANLNERGILIRYHGKNKVENIRQIAQKNGIDENMKNHFPNKKSQKLK